MRHSNIALALTVSLVLGAIFSTWFFPFNGASLAGMVLGTGFIVVASLSGIITHLLNKEGN